jgi:hypothetical protein
MIWRDRAAGLGRNQCRLGSFGRRPRFDKDQRLERVASKTELTGHQGVSIMQARDVMVSPVITASKTATVREIAKVCLRSA